MNRFYEVVANLMLTVMVIAITYLSAIGALTLLINAGWHA